jgi:hypothetical protein
MVEALFALPAGPRVVPHLGTVPPPPGRGPLAVAMLAGTWIGPDLHLVITHRMSGAALCSILAV